MKIQHAPKGEGETCTECGKARKRHRRKRKRAFHAAEGDPCKRCLAPKAIHISHKAIRERKLRDQKRAHRQSAKTIIGIDGEGHDLPDGRHIYTLLSAVNEHGRLVGEVENQAGLSTKECAHMLLDLPRDSLKFIFMGSYDFTKIIEDLPLEDIYYLMRPETRELRFCRDCGSSWRGEKKECAECGNPKARVVRELRKVLKDRKGGPLRLGFDWFNGSFTVAEPATLPSGRGRNDRAKRSKKRRWGRRTKVWDCFKFFQSSFVKAIENWKVGTPEERAQILEMKNKRGAFASEDPNEIRRYCRKECELLAQMMRRLIENCRLADIRLTTYYGAGSIASALLKAHGIKEHLGPRLEELPPEFGHAVMSAYFGGRFENSIVGAVKPPVFNRDIFSAYPYALAGLPCLACGTWSRVTKDVLARARRASLAVVQFRVKPLGVKERAALAWAPLPFREKNRTICYPTGFFGWAWLPELEAALRGWPELVEVFEAFVYRTDCEHKPFAWIPEAYRKRFEWGKDGRGIVMKLGLNACAGKTMQNQGDPPPYKSWIWGGMVTATTRAQVLDAVRSAKDRRHILAIATDGIFTTEELTLPSPANTGTEDLEKPLGAWGSETHEDGVFFVKPGMYFDDARLLMRARGIGRQELGLSTDKIARAFEGWDRESEIKIGVKSRRFFGARSSVLGYSQCSKCKTGWPGIPRKGCPTCECVGDRFDVGEMKLRDGTIAYGRWDERKINIAFEPWPKREYITKTGSFGRMRLRDLGDETSLPYSPGETTMLGLEARAATDEALEQPDWSDED